MQMAAGVAEHDPRRRLARDARNGNRDRLAWRHYRLEPLDRRLLLHALLSGHRHVEAVGQWRVPRSLEKESSCHFLAVESISPFLGVGCIKAVATDAEAGRA